MNYLVFPHLGLGDQLIMNGYIHFLLKTQSPNKIKIIAYDNYQRKTLLHLYSDISKVEFLWIEHPKGISSEFLQSINGKPFLSSVEIQGEEYKLLNFGVHSQFRSAYSGKNSWADSFYIQGQLDPSYRFSHFTLPANMSNADALYKRIVDKVGTKYVLVNDEPKTNRYLNGTLIKALLDKSRNSHLPVLYLGLDRYKYPLKDELNNIDVSSELTCDSMLNLWKLIENATECHFMDSSIACMTDLMKKSTSIVHLHQYASGFVDINLTPNPTVFVNRNWIIWYKDTF